MRLIQLQATNFRCFEHQSIEPGPGLNVLAGDNASGKTSVLEAIYMLGRGESFRGTAVGPLRRHGQDSMALTGRLLDDSGRSRRIGMAWQKHTRLQYKLDGRLQTRRYDLVSALPLQLIDPNLHRLLEQGPRFRRRFLDWGVFHVERGFFEAWRQYRQALRQRNGALRNRAAAKVIQAWDGEIISAAGIVDGLRRHYLELLCSTLPETVTRVLGTDVPSIRYYPGWKEQTDFADALARSLERDRKAGHTHVGPHRADIRLDVNGVSARSHVSRGQQKMFAAALLLAQARLLSQETGISPLLLIDDLAAELGATYMKTLLEEVDALQTQCFLTTLSIDLLPALQDATRVFHVEHGRLTPA